MDEDRDSEKRRLSILICENFPFNITIFMDGDECTVEEISCKYCSYDYKCTKDTYIKDDLFIYT